MGLVVVLLLLLSGDVETNPGPVGEGSVFNAEFPLIFICYTVIYMVRVGL